MNNTQFITSRLYRPTPRSVVYAGLPLLFAVHPAFILATSGDEGLPVVISADVFKSADAKKSAVDNMYSTFGKALVASPLVVAFAYPVLRGHARTSSGMGQLKRARGLFSFAFPLVRNGALAVGAVALLMAVDVQSWLYRMDKYGPDKITVAKQTTYFRNRELPERCARLLNQSLIPLALCTLCLDKSSFMIGAEKERDHADV